MNSPLSNSPNCTLLHEVPIQEIVDRWKHELGISWLPPSHVSVLQYWKDNQTGLYFYTPPQSAGGEILYKELQKFPWYYMKSKWEFNKALKILKQNYQNASAKILEVGVGQGFFLEHARSAGYCIEGVELNPDAASASRQRGFQVYNQDLLSLQAKLTNSLDAICSFQVLEHLPCPKPFLEQAISLLKPGGLLLLSVPNSAVSRKLDPNRYDLLDQPPHHMTHWDENVFRSLEDLLPVKVVHLAFEPLAPYHISWFMSSWKTQISSYYGTLAGRLAFNRWSSPIIRTFINLGIRHAVRGHTILACFQKVS